MTTAKLANTEYPVLDLIKERWSPRAFAPTLVEEEKLLSIFEAARWSPSSNNVQPWSFIMASQQDKEGFARMVDCLMEGNVPWASKAPVLILTVAQIYLPERERPHPYGWHDMGLAVQNMVLQATSMGLHLHQMGGFSKDKAKANFSIPEHYEPLSMIALGYLGNPEDLPERYQAGEVAQRERKSIRELVFEDTWGKMASLVQ
ncbi:MAG: nitroreductase family protein [Chloroflexota bacterium]